MLQFDRTTKNERGGKKGGRREGRHRVKMEQSGFEFTGNGTLEVDLMRAAETSRVLSPQI